MKIKKYRPFYSPDCEEHEQWLAAMARQGWHYKGQDFIGFQHFEQGAPAEMAFCWSQAPGAKEDAPAFRQKCRAAGWEMVASVGRWYCWSKAVVPGQTVPSLRDQAGTIAMWLNIQRQCASQAILMSGALFLNFPALFGKGRPYWHTIAVMVIMAVFVAMNGRRAFKAKARVRQLGPGPR